MAFLETVRTLSKRSRRALGEPYLQWAGTNFVVPHKSSRRKLWEGGMATVGKCFLISSLAAAVGGAQTFGGVFRGEIHDESNAVVQRAGVLIESVDTGTRVLVQSNNEGLYITPNLIPGSYVLSALKAGFKTEVFGPVVLEVNQIVRVDFALALGTAPSLSR